MATRSTEGLEATVEVLYPRYRGSPVTAYKSEYDLFPPVANNWGIIHPIPDMAPPLLAEEVGPPTQKELDLGATRTDPPPHRDKDG
jgi:hypothetical protein